MTIQFYNGFQFSLPVNLIPHFSKFVDFRHPNTPSKYYKILPFHTERVYHTPCNLKSIYWIKIYRSDIGKKQILLYFCKSVTVPPCCNFAINWWYHQLHVGGYKKVLEPPEFLHLLCSSYFLRKGTGFIWRWFAGSRPPSECVQFFSSYTATYVSSNYWICIWHHVAHPVFYLNIYIYILEEKLTFEMLTVRGQQHSFSGRDIFCLKNFDTFPSTPVRVSKTRPTPERRKTLGHLSSINRNMIIHFANQSQTCQLLIFFFKHFMKRNCEKWCNQSQVELI